MSIYHHVYNLEHLRSCYKEMEGGKAPGVDGVGKDDYGKNLEENLQDLSERLARMGYRPKPVKRVYIDKAGSRQKRPLGIPCFEDKLVQKALSRVLEQIYEEDFLPCSYGYRPGRSPHQAIDLLGRTIQGCKVSWVAEADIRSYFDRVNHEWLMEFVSHRVGDQRVLRLIRRFLKAGVMEDGLKRVSEEGTPQGGVLSALLSNIYLHYALDLWVEKKFRRHCRGEMYFFRYADDFLCCFQYRREAKVYLEELEKRLGKFDLQLAEEKTRLVSFGRFAEVKQPRGGGKNRTFDFLGFNFYCGRTRQGSFKVKRRTSRKKFRYKLKQYNQWLRQKRNYHPTGVLVQRSQQRLQGHLNYYAITDNGPRCQAFRNQVERLLLKWLNRRSQRRSYTFEQFNQLLAWHGWPTVKIRHPLCPFAR
jgi:group II intron reverse transcriptase/maturase